MLELSKWFCSMYHNNDFFNGCGKTPDLEQYRIEGKEQSVICPLMTNKNAAFKDTLGLF